MLVASSRLTHVSVREENRSMSDRRVPRPFVAAVGLLLAVATTAAAQPNTIFNTYVLFAQDNLRVRTATVTDGNIGVNDGLLYFRGAILAPQSEIAAETAHMDKTTSCEELFTDSLVGGSASCPGAPGDVPAPLFGNALDLAALCDFPPVEELECGTADVLVDHDQTTELDPGNYRNLVVEGGGRGPAVLKLEAGNYRFCNVRVGRNGSILFAGPAHVTIAGTSRVSNAAYLGPDTSVNPPTQPGAIEWFVGGSQARFSRKGEIRLYACAPLAKMIIGSGVALEGRFVARSIRMKKSTVTFAPPVPGVCGDTVLSPGEQCEVATDCGPAAACVACACVGSTTTTTTGGSTTTTTTLPECDDDEDCNEGSPGGGFVCEDGHCVPECEDDEDCNEGSPGGGFVCEDGHCVPACDDDEDCNQGSPGGGFVCEDGHCVPGSTTTTTTTGGSSTSTTTTTLRPCTTTDDCPVGVCRDGVCVPECDSDDDCMGSPDASFVCLDGRCVPLGETCGDCLDNDGDGQVDFEDEDCCDAAAGQLFQMDLRKGRLRSRGASQSALRLKATLARTGLAAKLDPPGQLVGVQIRSEAGEVLCASVPTGSFKKRRNAYRFSRKKTPVPVDVGRNLDRIQVKKTKTGQVRFRLKAKRAELATPAEGILRITVGFTRGDGIASQNACSQAVRLFRGGKRGQLTFP
jgi:hypothetical protein